MIEDIQKKVREKLKDHPKRLQHVQGVYETALKLAQTYKVNLEDAAIAALYHDYAKYDDLEQQIEHLDLKTIKTYANIPVIYHAFAAAIALEFDFGIKNQDILNAIRYHVWGRIGMSTLEKIIFVSDSCEPYRGFHDSDDIFHLALKDLDQAVAYCMKASIDHLIEKDCSPSEEQVDAYIYYTEVNGGKSK